VNPLPALLLSVGLLGITAGAHAQTAAPDKPAVPPTQLDRIEQKLEEVLRRLDQPHAAAPGALQGGPAAVGAALPRYRPGTVVTL
jgi:hypothetical protein